MSSEEKYSRLTYSYLDLRKAVGWIGILLPFVLMLGLHFIFSGENTPTSISHYYYTSMRNVFVGSLCAVALFMFFYTGYGKMDNWLGNIAGIFAIGVAWFPTAEIVGEGNLSSTIHYISATIFFLCLAVFSFFLFTKCNKEKEMSIQKKSRNVIYKVCGIIIIICLVAIAVHKMLGIHESIVFWAEALALLVFGISWLTKGETFYPDK